MIRVANDAHRHLLPFPDRQQACFESRLNEILAGFISDIQQKQLVLEVSCSGPELTVSDALLAEFQQVVKSTIQSAATGSELTIFGVCSDEGVELEVSCSGSKFMENLPAHLAIVSSGADETSPVFRSDLSGDAAENDSEIIRYCLACPQGGVAWTIAQRSANAKPAHQIDSGDYQSKAGLAGRSRRAA